MLTRLYVDNYKCLVNFDLRLGREHLLMGRNGTGKTTVFEVLSCLRRLYCGREGVTEVFPPSTLTRWQKRNRQLFELELALDGAGYRYLLEVEHDAERARSHIYREELYQGETLLFSYEPGQQFSKFLAQDGQNVALWGGGERPSLGMFRDSPPWHHKIKRFANWFERLYVVRGDPRRMSGRSEAEEVVPGEDLSNFASWYRHLAQERLNEVVQLRDDLRDVLEGFDSLVLKSGGEGVRMLRALWTRGANGSGSSATDEYTFEELSEGQRAIIGLYTLLHFLSGSGATLCLDEPDNFVALSEIQPFLLALRDQERIQTLLISHHPEVINLLAPGSGLWFERVSGGPVRVRPFQAPPDAAVPAAEIVARGWEDGK